MRKNIVAGNWKMNLTFENALSLARDISHSSIPANTEVILAPPFPYLKSMIDMLLHVPQVCVAAQNCHQKSEGAYTGEVSAKMIASVSCPYVIIGHSERRQYQSESNMLLSKKVDQALQHNLKVIFCCGENLQTRKNGKETQFVTQQLYESLFHLTSSQWENIVIAYEPIWAIGTGETATSEQAQAMHSDIRAFIGQKYGQETADKVRILYGGSVKPNNAQELFSQPDIDGGLVGGASLKSESFEAIIAAS